MPYKIFIIIRDSVLTNMREYPDRNLLSTPIQNFGKDNRQHDGNVVYSEFCQINRLRQCIAVQFLSVEAFDKKRQCCYNVRYEMKIL